MGLLLVGHRCSLCGSFGRGLSCQHFEESLTTRDWRCLGPLDEKSFFFRLDTKKAAESTDIHFLAIQDGVNGGNAFKTFDDQVFSRKV